MERNPADAPVVPDLPDSAALLEYLHRERAGRKKVIAFAIGTRPESIKIAPTTDRVW